MNRSMKAILPVLVIAVSIMGAVIIVKSKPEIETEPVKISRKIVRIQEVYKEQVRISVKTQGTVVPRTESILVSQVTGEVTKISPAFASGGFFEKGEVLVKIDDKDYLLAITQTKLQVAQAELSLKIEEQEAEIAQKEWSKLNSGKIPSLVAREPQLKEAKAALEAANASLKQTEINLERTNIKAPYSGRVRTKSVDIGQFVNPGMNLANIYAVDYAEVRLPIPDAELAFIDFPVDFRGMQNQTTGPKVTLRAKFAGEDQIWVGYLTRIEGEIDARSRMVYAVARVEDPYGTGRLDNKPPLTVGMFVHAEIEGKLIQDVFVLPRSSIRNNGQVLIVDSNDKLRFRNVEYVKLDSDNAYISSGLEPGEKVCITNLVSVVDGMPVEIFSESGDMLNGKSGGRE